MWQYLDNQLLRVFLFGALLFSTMTACAPIGPEVSLQDELVMEERIEALLGEATQRMREGTNLSYDQAFAALELARDLKPNDPRVIDGLGCVEWRRGNYDLAEHFFSKALELNPRYDRAYAHLAFVAKRKGDLEAARDLLKIAVALNPLNFRSRNNYAIVLAEQNDEREAYHQLLKAYQSGGRGDIVLDYNLERVGR